MTNEVAGVLIKNGEVGFICTTDDFHPYECGQNCIHCKKEKTKQHNPKKCALCKEQY
jgi:hypothetical protein